MLELGVKVLLAYLLGSVLGSLVVGKLKGGVDIRQMGSHNPGGTNALRTQGRAFALWVMVSDVGKGAVASSLIPAWHIPGSQRVLPRLERWCHLLYPVMINCGVAVRKRS